MFEITRRMIQLLVLAPALAQATPGFIVVAPDRGFTGNEAVRDGVAAFAENQAAALVFVTEEGTADRLYRAQAALKAQNAEPIILMPFYLTTTHPDIARIKTWLADREVNMGRPFGRSAMALAALEIRLRKIEQPSKTHLVLIGHGAATQAQTTAMQEEFGQLLETAARGLGFGALDAVVWPNVDAFDEDDYRQRLTALENDAETETVVLPFHLGPELDTMMGFTPRLQAAAPEDVTVLDGASFYSPVKSWLAREAARYQILDPETIGVVVHAHGADWQWNETMRQGAAPLAEDYLVEYAFSMGDPVTLEHAISHLEERGAKAIVIVRVFSMTDSFRNGIVRFIGQAWETCEALESNPHHHGHGRVPEPVLQTTLPVVTVGGLEDHPMYAKALYQRALAISKQPSKETIILVAHGLGNEQGNAHWRAMLESIREQMQRLSGDQFRAIEVGLWSEDWPELRQSAVEHVRALVKQANENAGRTLVIPARTLGQGPADEYLEGLDYTLGEGFAPHPLFAEWLREQVELGVGHVFYDQPEAWRCQWN